MIYYLNKNLHVIINFNLISFKNDQFYIYKENKVFLLQRIPVQERLLLLSMVLHWRSNIKEKLFIHRQSKLYLIKNIVN
jgi:hypothetical protein